MRETNQQRKQVELKERLICAVSSCPYRQSMRKVTRNVTKRASGYGGGGTCGSGIFTCDLEPPPGSFPQAAAAGRLGAQVGC